MGTVNSTHYYRMHEKPFRTPYISNPTATGSEFVRFCDVLWTEVQVPKHLSSYDDDDLKDVHYGDDGSPVVYTQEVLRVRGITSGEDLFISKDALLRAVGGDLEESNKFIGAKKNHLLYVVWKVGVATDSKGRLRTSFWAVPAHERRTGRMLVKSTGCYSESGSDCSTSYSSSIHQYSGNLVTDS